MSEPEPVLLIRGEGVAETRFSRGGVFRIGRHGGNNLVLDHPTVSSFHVRITWAHTRERPEVRDEGSRNGTWLQGERLAPAADLPADGEAHLRVGEVELTLELLHPQALIADATSEKLSLFSDEGPELEGSLGAEEDLESILRDLEVKKRTGTLTLQGVGSLTFFMGKVMGAECGDKAGMHAVKPLLAAPEGTSYRFVKEFEPSTEPLGFWPSDLLRRMR